jgi:hypothetical protein
MNLGVHLNALKKKMNLVLLWEAALYFSDFQLVTYSLYKLSYPDFL